MPLQPSHRSATLAPFTTLLVLVLALSLSSPLARSAEAQGTFQTRTTTLNRVGLTVTNYGFLGNNFVSRTASAEYPLGLGFEHMSRAGLWVGGLVITEEGEEYRVSTGAIDNSQGTTQAADTEWRPGEAGIAQRSNLTNSQFFHPDAVSEQDFVCTYRDFPGGSATGINFEDHVPLQVEVEQEIYSFSIEPASDFVVIQYKITNHGPLLRDVFVGLYTQLVSGDKGLYSVWPPSSASGPGSWYRKHYIDYLDSLRLAREHICTSLPPGEEPEQCVGYDQAPYWAGSMLLGIRGGTLADKEVGFRLWNWSPTDTTRDEDAERYELLSRPGVDPPSPSLGEGASPIEMISVGPIPLLQPDSSVTVNYALVFGATRAELSENAAFAQFAFDLDFRLPKPPPSPRLHARPDGNSVTLLWDDSPESASDETSPAPGGIDFQGYRVYFGEERIDLPRTAQWDIVDSTGFNTGLESLRLPEPVIIDGDTLQYGYRIDGLRDGFSYFAAVTSFDTGDQQVPSLESGITQNKLLLSSSPAPGAPEPGRVTVFPNPYKVDAVWDAGSLARDQYLWFANLPERCRIKVYSLAGDLVFETNFDGNTYDGSNARGFYDPAADLDVSAPSLSGGSYAWDLITREGQAIVSGLYIYTVEDRDSGNIQRGKFLVLKSDREGF